MLRWEAGARIGPLQPPTPFHSSGCCCSGLVPNRKGHRATAKGQRSAARLLAQGAGQGQQDKGSRGGSAGLGGGGVPAPIWNGPLPSPPTVGCLAGLGSVRMGGNRPTSFMVSAVGADGLRGKLHLKGERSPALWSTGQLLQDQEGRPKGAVALVIAKGSFIYPFWRGSCVFKTILCLV